MAGHPGVASVGRRGLPCTNCEHLKKDHQADSARTGCTIPGCKCNAYANPHRPETPVRDETEEARV